MTEISNKIFNDYGIRNTKQQKKDFIDYLKKEYPNLKEEKSKGIISSNNLIIGDVDKADIVFSAHYDTPAVMPFPNFLAPKNFLITIGYQIAVAGILLILLTLTDVLVFAIFDYINFNSDMDVFIVIFVNYGVIILFLYVLMFGKPNKNNANDNTSGIITLIEIYSKLEEKEKEKTAIVFFDNEEKGLIGSREFKKRHKEKMKTTLLVNFDCVSDGDNLLIIQSKNAQKKYGEIFKEVFINTENKAVILDKASKAIYPSDQMGYSYNLGIAAFNKKKFIGLYVDKIHTKKDVVFDKENIYLLSELSHKLIKSI